MKVRRYRAEDAAAIDRLNTRLKAAAIDEHVFGEGVEQHRKGTIRERLFVAEDGDEIRGAVWLREQPFRIRGQDVVMGWLKYPVAESLIDPKYNGVPGSLLIQCVREQPLLLALGLGGHTTPLARMLKAMRWTGTLVPMLVRLVRPGRCLRQLAPLRRTGARRAVADVLAWSGLAWLGGKTLHLFASARGGRPAGYTAELCDELGPWADELWTRTRDSYEVIASRDAETVESILPMTSDVRRLRVRYRGSDVGWVYVIRHDFSTGKADRTFGRLTVGLIGDCLATPEHAAGVLAAGVDHLLDSGVDVAFSQQLHPAWSQALRRQGFIDAPSNFAFYASPKALVPPVQWSACHINRGDCDGPVWYAHAKDFPSRS